MESFKKIFKGLLVSLVIAVPSWFLGKLFPVVGGPVFAIIIGMAATNFIKEKSPFEAGIKFCSKKILQWAVILLGFGLDLGVVAKTGAQSLPIILSTILTSLVVAFAMCKAMKIPSRISTLVGVGSSICGGSAIAATAPVISATDEEVAQSISVIFFFNVLAAIIFPYFGQLVGFSTVSGDAFGIFAGTAVNDTSSVTAAASTWDAMYSLGSQTLDKAVTVKLTRTIAIIPITLVLALYQMIKAKKESSDGKTAKMNFDFKKIFPFFILWFILASVLTTLCHQFLGEGLMPYADSVFKFLKTMSKFFIVLAMAAIGLNTDIIKLIKTGGKPLIMGACCWIAITAVSLGMQHILGIW
ncbi:YeiH family protein [Treponema sp.]|uniref:YeiH family protein n=1 Tax=Treponema sp. TaxID=166 RepID=UPI003EFFA9BA